MKLSHDDNLRFYNNPLTDRSTGLWARPCENIFENKLCMDSYYPKSALQDQVSTKMILLIYFNFK